MELTTKCTLRCFGAVLIHWPLSLPYGFHSTLVDEIVARQISSLKRCGIRCSLCRYHPSQQIFNAFPNTLGRRDRILWQMHQTFINIDYMETNDIKICFKLKIQPMTLRQVPFLPLHKYIHRERKQRNHY